MSKPLVKVFSSTLARDRDVIGEVVTKWLLEHPEFHLVELRTLQSSDNAYHCLSFILIGNVEP